MSDTVAQVDLLIKSDAELAALVQWRDGLQAGLKLARESGRDVAPLEAELGKVNRQLGQRTFDVWEKGLQGLIEKNRAAGQSTTDLELKLKAMQEARPLGLGGKMTQEMKGLLDQIPGLGVVTRMLNGGTVAVGAMFAGLAGGARLAAEGVREYAEAEKQWASLDAALANRGLLVDTYRERLSALAAELQSQTGVADDNWLAAFARLTTAGMNPANLAATTDAVKNLAGLLEGDVSQASLLVSRALQGNFEGLSRAGVMFEKTGDQARDLERFFALLAERGGGLLEARMDTISGRAAAARNAFSDFKEAIGQMIADTGVLQTALLAVQGVFESWSGALGRPVDALDRLQNRLVNTTRASEDTKEAARKLADEGLRKISEEARTADAELEKTLRRLREFERRATQRVDVNLQLELARLDAGEGPYAGFTEGEKEKKRAELRGAAESRRQEIADETAGRATAAMESRQGERAQAAAAAQQQAAQDEAARQRVEDENRARDAEQNALYRRLIMARANRDSLAAGQPAGASVTPGLDGVPNVTQSPGQLAELAAHESRMAAARAEIDRLMRQLESLAAAAGPRQTALDQATIKAGSSRQQADQLAKDSASGRAATTEKTGEIAEERRHERWMSGTRQQAQEAQGRAPRRRGADGEALDGTAGAQVADEIGLAAGEVGRLAGAVGNPDLRRALGALQTAAETLRDGGTHAETSAVLADIAGVLSQHGRSLGSLKQQLAQIANDLQGQIKEGQN